GLEEYLEQNEPIPFIVDDILIKFDDDRSAAALKALAQLSARNSGHILYASPAPGGTGRGEYVLNKLLFKQDYKLLLHCEGIIYFTVAR
ncbi:MAG: hypothetical protein JRE64_28320, partial [Deltaproteobacteria bacterium]|nr:hypothetical protein [Deltaproteobacteria bacterium]